MIVRFRTNIDCAQKLMPWVNERLADTVPNVGDIVNVYEEPNKIVEMKVVGITLRYSELHKQSMRVAELQLTSFWQEAGLKAFENHVG